MSIITKTGDKGTTALMYGRRVMKCHPRVEAYGAVDELNSALGLARATAEQDAMRENLLSIQKDLVVLMGELAVAAEDLERYVKDGYALVTPEMTCRLEKQSYELEAGTLQFKGWATPGATVHSAALDVARSVCRRAERRIGTLQQDGQLRNSEVLIYLNRLSDLLFLLARKVETDTGGSAGAQQG
jgi:cob(I)alamin adenosyltransferase